MSNAVAGATGPHYYQELYASPHDVNEIYHVFWEDDPWRVHQGDWQFGDDSVYVYSTGAYIENKRISFL